MKIKAPPLPTESICCIALIKPGSSLSRELKLEKPSYAIYEYTKAFGTREIRWGDGSWKRLTAKDNDDLILLPQLGEKFVDELFA